MIDRLMVRGEVGDGGDRSATASGLVSALSLVQVGPPGDHVHEWSAARRQRLASSGLLPETASPNISLGVRAEGAPAFQGVALSFIGEDELIAEPALRRRFEHYGEAFPQAVSSHTSANRGNFAGCMADALRFWRVWIEPF
jgi:hypothetical protein